MDSFIILMCVVFLPFFSALFVPIASQILKKKIGWFATFIAAVCFMLLLYFVPDVSSGNNISGSVPWISDIGIDFSFYGDGLSVLLALIISFIGIMIMFYSNGYLSPDEDLVRYYQYILVFMGSMLGVAFSDNMILLFLFWELTSISSFLLIGYYRETEKSIYGATKALLITGGGGLFMLLGFLGLSIVSGTFGISEILQNPDMILSVRTNAYFTPILFLILIGAFAKSAQGPFYIWLPNAMEAPTPVSAFLHSATMVKAGVFLIARIHPLFSGTPSWFYAVCGIGLITMICAGFLAIRQTDLKAILAFSTISQLAYLVTMYGFTTAALPGIGVCASTFHLLNHATFKACLFLLVGIIAHAVHTRDIQKMGGLRKNMPITFILTTIAAASMAGIPPLNGYLSKELFYESAIEMGQQIGGIWTALMPLLALLGGIFTFMYSFRLVHKVFLGTPGDQKAVSHAHDPGPVMLIPAIILTSLIILIGLFPNIFIERLVQPAIDAVAPGSETLKVALWHGFTKPFIMTIITILIGILMYMRYEKIAVWQNDMNRRYPWFSFNYWYNKCIKNTASLSSDISRHIQRGPPTGYMIWTLLFALFLILLPLSSFYFSGGRVFDAFRLDLPLSEYFLIGVIILTALGAAIAPDYIVAILSLSAVGYFVSLLYAFLKAPDLSMTQICIETLSTILFLLVIMKLRKRRAVNPDSPSKKITKIVIGAASGLCFFLIILSTGIVEPFSAFSEYFVQNAIELTGGRNIVNVIVVDFRGYDTIGEITVLSLAALGVYNFIRGRGLCDKEAEKEADGSQKRTEESLK